MSKGMLLVISGPSGAGKSTIIRHMMDERLNCRPCEFSISMTTRQPRAGEVDGVHYHFVTREAFEESIAEGAFLEYARYDKDYYGTPLAPILRCIDNGGCAILDIEVQGMRQVVKKMPECVTVFITPPSLPELERRLRGRKTETEERILKRLDIAGHECSYMGEYKYLIVNDAFESAALGLASVIRAECLKTTLQPEIVQLFTKN